MDCRSARSSPDQPSHTLTQVSGHPPGRPRRIRRRGKPGAQGFHPLAVDAEIGIPGSRGGTNLDSPRWAEIKFHVVHEAEDRRPEFDVKILIPPGFVGILAAGGLMPVTTTRSARRRAHPLPTRRHKVAWVTMY